MNKDDLTKAVYEAHGGLSLGDARRIVDLLLEIIKSRLAKSEKVLISGFGCFRIVRRKDRKGINPQTGDPIIIRGRKAITFKPSKNLRSV